MTTSSPAFRRSPRLALASIAMVVGATLAPAHVQAGTATTSFTVTATVQDACSVTANDLSFGAYDPGSATPLDVSTTLSVTCTAGTAYSVRLNEGTTAGATVTTRQMASGANRLNYALYRDAGRAQNWGQTDSVDTASGVGSGSAAPLTIYGRVPINQHVAPATYTDTITVTINF